MITFLLGLPGSGKSYYAVDRIYNNFSSNKDAIRDKKVTFKNCYTNINEFNFDKLDNVSNLDFDHLYKILTRLHKLYKEKKTDAYLVKFLIRVKLKDTLFVIDEAHNHFDREDKVLVWWLSYHRHLYHEIILITQSLALINAKYKKFSEFFYKARASSLTFDKRYFIYTVFCDSRLALNSKSGVVKVKRRKNVFDLYKSGDSLDSKNVLMKFFIMGVVLLIFLIFVLYLAFSQTKVEKKQVQKQDQQTQILPQNSSIQETNSISNHNQNYENMLLIDFKCNKTLCSFFSHSIHKNVFNHYVENEQIKIIYTSYKNHAHKIITCELDKSFFTFLKGEIYNENKDLNDASFLPTFGSK